MTTWSLRWGRSQCLYRAAPYHVIRNPNTGLHEMVWSWRDRPDGATSPELVRDALRREFRQYAVPPVDPNGIGTMRLDLRTLEDAETDHVQTLLYPTAFVCDACGHIVAEDPGSSPTDHADAVQRLGRRLPPNMVCGLNGCRGRLRQWRTLTVHECGEILHLPTSWAVRCNVRAHGNDHLHFLDHGSERTSSWEVVCRGGGCNGGRRSGAFYLSHPNCPLTGRIQNPPPNFAQYSTGPIQKATNFLPKVIHILNSNRSESAPPAGSPQASAVALGTLGLAEAFTEFDQHGGARNWINNYAPAGHARHGDGRALQILRGMPQTPEILASIQQLEGESRAAPDLTRNPLFVDLVNRGSYVHEAAAASIYLQSGRSRAINDFRNDSATHETTRSALAAAATLQTDLGFRQIRHVEDIALTNVLVGYTRGDYDPTRVRLQMYLRSQGAQNVYQMYTNTVETEGIFVQLDPTKTLRWLASRDLQGVTVANTFTQDLFELQTRFLEDALPSFQSPTDQWTGHHFGLLHTVSHLLIRAIAEHGDLDQEAMSEAVYPYQNGFLVYANQSTDFKLEGLALTFEHELDRVLRGLRDQARRCIYDPQCSANMGSCHGCVQVAEFSCENFNRILDRRLAVGRNRGFWD